MKKLLNTLFVLTPETYLSLEGENVVVQNENETLMRVPLHTLETINYFGYKGASPALLGKCVNLNIRLNFYKPSGRYLASVSGEFSGNVLLRKKQYSCSDNLNSSLKIARYFVLGKVFNARWVIERTLRDNPLQVDTDRLKNRSEQLKEMILRIKEAEDLEQLRGYEGVAAEEYFSIFNNLILNRKNDFVFSTRNKRPPLDRVNALLSFVYSLLANDCAAALSGVGLDPYVGFLHRDRPGRISLALDLMEELRPAMADRFVLTLINNHMVQPCDFELQESGAVLLNDIGRKQVLTAWQSRKQSNITHPYLQEKIPWGLVPHSQALLLARHLRSDLDAYPPFLWK